MRQLCLHRLGSLIQSNCLRLLPFATLALILLCSAIRSAKFDTQLANWIQRTPSVDSELNYVSAYLGQGSSSQILLQTPRQADKDVLSVESMMLHLEALAIATHVTVDLFDVSWSIKDVCYTPTVPDFFSEGFHVTSMLENIMPCVIKTPLDCFWEGAKLLGPEQPVFLGSIGPMLKWTNLNPKAMVETMKRTDRESNYPYSKLLDWMKRVGITTGYQFKPCLDPTDPNCPITAPNKFTNILDVAAELTDGCRGFASKQMHWKEDEIVGGISHNKSGHIVDAKAIQSTILIMGEQDMYDYWKKTNKVLDINNWSVEKARLVIEAWQDQFNQELARFSKTYQSSNEFKIHTITAKSMIDPIDESFLSDYNNLLLSFTLMTIVTSIMFPRFDKPNQDSCSKLFLPRDPTTCIGRFKMTILAIIISLYVGLTFCASLGLSSFFNLPFNMATTQILPPLALYYGFNQFNMIAHIYSQRFERDSWASFTTDCLQEIFPIVTIESITHIIALLIAGLVPVQATRVFIFQAITFILLITLVALTVVPSIMTAFVVRFVAKTNDPNSNSHNNSTTKTRKITTTKEDYMIEEQIFSRIQEDLKNIQSDNPSSSDIRFSASIGDQSLQTTFKISSNRNTRGCLEPRTPCLELDKLSKDSKNESGNVYSYLPDLKAPMLYPQPPTQKLINFDENMPTKNIEMLETKQIEEPVIDRYTEDIDDDKSFFGIYARSVTMNRFVQVMICLTSITILVAMLPFAPKVDYGLQLKDIISHDARDYEPLATLESHFHIHNIFIVTKKDFDYPSNQRNLYNLHKAIERVDCIVKSDDSDQPKFWLATFRDWLIDLQQDYDANKNRSLFSGDGNWGPYASDTTKLAFKLLAQTGRSDNPVDKSIVDTNRLVDSDGIVNQKAFYYYLSAWVMSDTFSYANTEAMLKPEPKIWNSLDLNQLKIEKARPITYAQMPFLMKLDHKQDKIKAISEIRRISRSFESVVPNFPTGNPFIFWDQFLNLDILFFGALFVVLVLIFSTIGLMISDFNISAISVIPVTLSSIELYGLLGYLSIPFNNILGVLLIITIGISMIQTIHITSVSITCQ